MENRRTFSHLDKEGSAKMVNVGDKKSTHRMAKAQAVVVLGENIIGELKSLDGRTKKGSVFDTARLAGIMGAKKTSDLIPLCHPLFIDGIDVSLEYWGDVAVRIVTEASTTGKTGVEMEALTAASVAALTVYDMCKAQSLTIEIKDVFLLEKKEEREIMSGHQKHKKIPRAHFGVYGRCELSFLGAPCGEIEALCQNLAKQTALNTLYIDSKHGDTLTKPELHVLEYQQDHWRLSLDDREDDPYAWRRMTDEYDLCLINGNHFKAGKQIICLHPKKYDSLKRKKDKLSRPIAMIDFTGEGVIPGELQEFLSEFKDLPIFEINQVSEIAEFVQQHCIPSTGLRGVVLTGGKSSRMGKDKSKLEYHGKEQWEHVKDLLGPFCEDVMVSVPRNFEISGPPFILDRLDNFGPFGGILSCFMESPNEAHLVLAVDLPFVNEEAIKTLLDNRNPYKTATAFLNPDSGFPEPLITIWEPKAYSKMLSFLSMGYTCPRKVLINSDIATAPLTNEKWIRNANTPEERAQVLEELGNMD